MNVCPIHNKRKPRQTVRLPRPIQKYITFAELRLMPKLRGYVLRLVHFAKRALMLYCRLALTHPQNFVRHHPWLDEHVGILDGHLVKNLVALPGQLLNDMQIGGMKQAAASEPRRIDEVGGIDHQRVALPFPDRQPVVIGFDRVGTLTAVGRDVAVLVVSAAVIGILVIE